MLVLCLIVAIPIAGTVAYASHSTMYKSVSSSYDYSFIEGYYTHSGYFEKWAKMGQSKMKVTTNDIDMTAQIYMYSSNGKTYTSTDMQTSSSLNRAVSVTKTASLFHQVNSIRHYTTAFGILGLSTLNVYAS